MSHNRFDLQNPAELLPLPPHDFQVLLLISDRALHGYGIVKASCDTTGKPRLELGSLYRILGRLMEMGLVEEVPIDQPDTKRKRRYYRTTAAGRRVARAEAQRLRQLLASKHAERLMEES